MKKTLEWFTSRGYLNKPEVSFVLNTHNMSDLAIATIKLLRGFRNSEIIVVDDGSEHFHTMALANELTGVNESLLHLSDLFEVLALNRAFSFARGDLCVYLQDDDSFNSMDWVAKAIRLFGIHPDMAILGGRSSVSFVPDRKKRPIKEHAINEFEFVQSLNTAPLWVRRSDFLALGGFDEDFAPFMYSESDLCLRAWLSGKSVGWYNSGRLRPVPTKERRLKKFILEDEATHMHFDMLIDRYGKMLGEINRIVYERNQAVD